MTSKESQRRCGDHIVGEYGRSFDKPRTEVILKAACGKVILTSHTHETKARADAGIASMKYNAPLAQAVDFLAEAHFAGGARFEVR